MARALTVLLRENGFTHTPIKRSVWKKATSLFKKKSVSTGLIVVSSGHPPKQVIYSVREKRNNWICFLLRFLGIRVLSMGFTNLDEHATKMIEDIIKTNGFVILNKKGEQYLLEFTLLNVIRDSKQIITEVRITHDIDGGSKQAPYIKIAGKVTNLQNMINYFKEI